MIDRLPSRLRLAFMHDEPPIVEVAVVPETPEIVDFVAYGADCVLSGRTILDGDRLSDMLNDHDEYELDGVRVERFDGGPPIVVDEIVVPRDELWLVHASGPRGAVGRRTRTAPQHVAIKMGPYNVRGFFHTMPGTDPLSSIQRRRSMIPLTQARIEYTIGGDERDERVDTLIVNRDQIEWLQVTEPDRAEFPAAPSRRAVAPKRLVTDGG